MEFGTDAVHKHLLGTCEFYGTRHSEIRMLLGCKRNLCVCFPHLVLHAGEMHIITSSIFEFHEIGRGTVVLFIWV